MCSECFQNMRGMLRNYRSALQGSLFQVECRGKTDSKLPPRADSPCHKPPMVALVLKNMIIGTQCKLNDQAAF